MNNISGKHESFWVDTSRIKGYPALEHAVHTDVVVIGGGITGITTALLLKKAGFTVSVLEADRILRGVTGYTTAKITSLHTLIYRHLVTHFGVERARQYGEANQAGLEKIAELVQEYSIDCDFQRKPFFTFAENNHSLDLVEKEVLSAREVGLPASFVESVPLPLSVKGAIRFDNQAQFHPLRYLAELAAQVDGDGSHVFENSRAVDVTEGEVCQVSTRSGGSANAPFVVIATHFPIHGRHGFYFARMHQDRHYVLAVKIPEAFPDGMFISAEEPSLSFRAAAHKDGELVIIGGGHHKSGQGGDTYSHYRKLIDRTEKVYPGSQVLYHWSTQDNMTVDKVPYIGKLTSGSSRILTATGFGAWGMTSATAAGMILTDMIGGKKNPWAPVFDPGRFTPGTSAKDFLQQNVNVGKEFIKGHLPLRSQGVQSVKDGEGRVLNVDGRKIGVYRDERGTVHAVHPICPHMGCTVAWNPAEKSWDCPCHGSRFDADGRVLHSPAMQDLEQVELSED